MCLYSQLTLKCKETFNSHFDDLYQVVGIETFCNRNFNENLCEKYFFYHLFSVWFGWSQRNLHGMSWKTQNIQLCFDRSTSFNDAGLFYNFFIQNSIIWVVVRHRALALCPEKKTHSPFTVNNHLKCHE